MRLPGAILRPLLGTPYRIPVPVEVLTVHESGSTAQRNRSIQKLKVSCVGVESSEIDSD